MATLFRRCVARSAGTSGPALRFYSRVRRVGFGLAALFTLMLPAQSRAQASTGVIEGRVFNSATGTALTHARVAIEGSGREVSTDEGGNYRLTGVPAGAAKLSVSYVGLQGQSATVNVTAGGVVQREFEMALDSANRRTASGEIIQLDAFSVAVDRQMSAQAISMNEQRTAPNIKNVVSMDEFGDRGNENLGEFLLFLPGVSVTTSGSEPTTVAMRGFPGNNTGLTVDGAEMTATFNGNSRALDLREVPFNNVSRVEITKVPTPDMPATGLGGSINLITRSGFESKSPKLSFNAYTMFHNRNGLTFDGGPRTAASVTSPKYIEPSFDFSYLYPINRNLAVTIGGSRTWRAKPMETGTKNTDETPTWDQVRLVQTASQWNSLAQEFKTYQGQIGIDWRLRPTDTFSVSAQYRSYALPITRSVLGFTYGAGATGGPTFTQGAATAVGSVTMNGSGENVDILTQTKLYNFKYRHRGDTWRIDVGSYYSTSGSNRADIDAGFFNTTPATISGLVLRGDGIPASGGVIPTNYTATNAAGRPVDVLDGGNYSIVSGNTNQPDFNSQRYNIRADLARDFRGPLPFTLKVGGLIDTMQNDQRRYPKTWTFRPNGATDATSRLASNFDVFDTAFNEDGPTLYGKKVRWISGTKLYQLYQKNPSWFVTDEAQIYQDYVTNSRSLTERVSAAYLRGDLRLLNNRLWLVGGVRFERTDDKGSGPRNDINAQFQHNPNGSLVDGNPNLAGIQTVPLSTDPLVLRKLRYKERGATSDQNYSGYYPSLNASFNITDNLILRAAYAQTLGRPNINNIIPSTSISDASAANPVITVNNSGLKPWSAKSYDLSIESYQIKDGFGSFGVFQKSIKDFFSSVTTAATPALLELYGLESDPALLTYNVTTLSNGGDATIKGMEFSYRQSLTFLPHWARGLQVFANATKLTLSGTRTADFSGYNPKSLAGGVSFVRGRIALKWTISYQGDINTGNVAASATVPAGSSNYQAKRTRIGVNAQYSFTKRYSIYASVVDWGGFVQDLQRYAPSTPSYARSTRWQELGYYTNIGVRGNF